MARNSPEPDSLAPVRNTSPIPHHPSHSWRIQRHREVSSTSDLAKEAPPWTVVVAERQTQGRGRLGRTWHSPTGGLWLSAVLPPPVPAQAMVALAVARALSAACGLPVRYEPPNDLALLGRKLGGVLVETVFAKGRPIKVVVGVGINVNNPSQAFPSPLSGRAIALVDVLGAPQDLKMVTRAVLAGIEAAHKEAVCHKWR